MVGLTGCASGTPAPPGTTPPVTLDSPRPARAPEVREQPAPFAPDEADLARCRSRALAAHPGLEAAREHWAAALERVPQAEALADPRLQVRYFLEEVETRVGPQELAVGVSQAIPWFGKRRLAGTIAEAEAEAARARFAEVALDVLLEVERAWFEAYYLERAIESVITSEELLRQLEEVVRSRYASGDAPFADLIRAQIERELLAERRRTLEDQRRPTAARLNAALHLPADTPGARPNALPPVSELAGRDELLARMARGNPELQALRQERAAAANRSERAGLDRRPDLTLGLEYVSTGSAVLPNTPGSGDDPLIASLSLNLPLQRGSYRARERETAARERAVALAIAATEDRLAAELEASLYRAREAARRVELYRDSLLPREGQAFEATESAFRSGSASFLDLVDAQRALLEFELSLARARTDLALAEAELQRLVGGPVCLGLEGDAQEESR